MVSKGVSAPSARALSDALTEVSKHLDCSKSAKVLLSRSISFKGVLALRSIAIEKWHFKSLL